MKLRIGRKTKASILEEGTGNLIAMCHGPNAEENAQKIVEAVNSQSTVDLDKLQGKVDKLLEDEELYCFAFDEGWPEKCKEFCGLESCEPPKNKSQKP